MKYYISDEAIKDLDNIWLYTLETWSAQQADRYFNLLLDEIEYIANHFEDGRNMDFIKTGYRVSKMKSHLIFYRKSTYDTVEIIRILHQMMDIEKIKIKQACKPDSVPVNDAALIIYLDHSLLNGSICLPPASDGPSYI